MRSKKERSFIVLRKELEAPMKLRNFVRFIYFLWDMFTTLIIATYIMEIVESHEISRENAALIVFPFCFALFFLRGWFEGKYGIDLEEL